jgi:DNA-directed RNA polymerase specialized sigma24 family protein
MPGWSRDNLEPLPEFYRRRSVNGRVIEPSVHDAFEKIWPWFWNHVRSELGDSTRAADLADDIVYRITRHVKAHPGQVHSLVALCRVSAENHVKTIKARERRIVFGGLGQDLEAALFPTASDVQRELDLRICAEQALDGEHSEFLEMVRRRLMDETWDEIGDALGMSAEQARRRYQRARERIDWDAIFPKRRDGGA